MTRVLVAAGVAELALLFALGRVPVDTAFPTTGLLLFAAAFAAYAVAARSLSLESGGERRSRDTVVTIWLFGIAFRLALLPLEPTLSDDFYRYLWDGLVQKAGVNPYLHAPAAAEVESLRPTWHGLINNPQVSTIYPPVAQVVFLLGAWAGSSLLALKTIWLACDLVTAWLVTRIAERTGRRPHLALLLYLWAPLLVVEVAWSAHLETLGIVAMMAAVLTPRGALAGVALALAALTKFAPAAALPALVRSRGASALVAFAATALVLYLPYLGAGPALFSGLRTYGEHWWFMQGAFSLLEAVAGGPIRARQLAALLVLAVVAWTVWQRFDLERALFWTLGAGMMLTPTFHPWYVLWMLPLAALRTSRAWLLLCGLTVLGYFGVSSYQSGGDWLQPGWLRMLLWLPFYGLLLHDVIRPNLSTLTEVSTKSGEAEPGVP